MTLTTRHNAQAFDARRIAVSILMRIGTSDAYLDRLLEAELRRIPSGDPGRRLLNELATGVVRWQLKLDWILSRHYQGDFHGDISPLPKCAMRLALYQILFLDRIPDSAAVNESVQIVRESAGRGAAGLVNAVLRSILRETGAANEPDSANDPMLTLAVRHSHPRWMVRRWTKRYGTDAAEQLMRTNNLRPPLSLRASPAKTPGAGLCYTLLQEGVEAVPAIYDPDVVIAANMQHITESAAFREGLFIVQDESAALAARLSGARPGMHVIDLCAAPGGKSMTMGFMMEGRGRILAVDLYPRKLARIAENARRVGLADLIQTVEGDARRISPHPADVVLVDAPCSGLGVLRKKPDIKWRRRPEDIPAMQELQLQILANAGELVLPGGHLVYTTCSTEPQENRDVVAGFLAGHPEFSLCDAAELLPREVVDDTGFLQTLPHVHGTDGAFGARMVRRT